MTKFHEWASSNLPNLVGKHVLITGANSGIGLETARAMAGRGAVVVLACRNASVSSSLNEKGAQQAMDDIRRTFPKATLEHVELDLSDLASVCGAASNVQQQLPKIDILINNAGVMWAPNSQTKDGFETHMGVNHLGHFALTGLLMPALLKSAEPRIITLSSLTHLSARMDLEDLFYSRRSYSPAKAYAQSKLANLMFSKELGRLLGKARENAISAAAHPGSSGTNLMVTAFRDHPLIRKFFTFGLSATGQSPQEAAMPSLYAATSKSVKNGDYIGPMGLFGLSGLPGPAYSTKYSNDVVAARELWSISEKLTGIKYNFSFPAS